MNKYDIMGWGIPIGLFFIIIIIISIIKHHFIEAISNIAIMMGILLIIILIVKWIQYMTNKSDEYDEKHKEGMYKK